MPSSISSSDQPVIERPIPRLAWTVAGMAALATFVVLLGGWEWHWRDFGAAPTYRNSDGLWAIQRRLVDRIEGDKTIIIGSSRVLFDIQLPVWEEVAGEKPIQLALEGTSPIIFLQDLADDPDFTGMLIVGVTPDLYFTDFGVRRLDALDYYRQETPSQWFGQRVSMAIEPYLGFYEEDYALFVVLRRLPWPAREGVTPYRDVRRLAVMAADRNTRLWSKLENDVAYRDYARNVWMQLGPPPGVPEEELRRMAAAGVEKAIAATRQALDKLEARGVDVIFVRMPSSGGFYAAERKRMPREQSWDRLIAETGAIGIHFEDHAGLQGLDTPEWSHLSGADAERATRSLYAIIRDELARRETQE
ncbi:MAG: hypothetical protein H0W33_05180 [Gammaproteobacteria bacterium]|nr:hypothetical protein [Gammaproteobacteria bacterium]